MDDAADESPEEGRGHPLTDMRARRGCPGVGVAARVVIPEEHDDERERVCCSYAPRSVRSEGIEGYVEARERFASLGALQNTSEVPDAVEV